MSVLNTDHSSPSPTTLPPPVPVTATPSHHLHLLQPHQPLTHRGLAHPQDANLGLGEDPTRVFFRYRPLPSAASSEPRAQPTRAQCQVTNHSPAYIKHSPTCICISYRYSSAPTTLFPDCPTYRLVRTTVRRSPPPAALSAHLDFIKSRSSLTSQSPQACIKHSPRATLTRLIHPSPWITCSPGRLSAPTTNCQNLLTAR